ncbi:hypothetical protein [Candidatus Macondimonas diazotrophica]|uniref:Nucleotidyltransferase domain-containing protein n=1 Tax=Candidatus Macondimonas diazotrophica TaxID=2305248 RepID=A0A4Z0F491_9GAMM|nr:hypothetical protein [Candidatus Macondimonas diazotrophica]TFZ79802.1 hypothetical protein E4680_13970 [Candidatus Macondimonas diazotrophica]
MTYPFDEAELPRLGKNVIRTEVLKYGTVTGSQAYGTARADSDFDIAVPIGCVSMVMKIIGDRETADSDYFAGFYFRDGDGVVVNIIPLHFHTYRAWILATKMMTVALKDMPYLSSTSKYAMFEGFVALFKIATPYPYGEE